MARSSASLLDGAPQELWRTTPEIRLVFVEYLLNTLDLETCARRGLEWLATHAGVPSSVCLAVDSHSNHLVALGEHGVTPASGWQFSVDLKNAKHPLVAVLNGRDAAHFPLHPSQPWTPLQGVSFLALPLRSGEGRLGLAEGLLLVAADSPQVGPDVRWFCEVFGQQLMRLRSRQVLAETRFGRERMLLYGIINAVTDPILLTDVEGKLIIANARAEKLFSAPEDANEGRRRAVSLNNMLYSAALSSSAMEMEAPFRGELLLVDPIDGSDLLFELLSSAVRDVREGTFVVSVLRNVTDLGRATREIEESQRKLRIAQTEVREERHRLELIIDSVADPILVTDPAGDIVLMNAPAEKLFTAGRNQGEEPQRRVNANGAHFTSFVSNLLFSGTDTRWTGEINLVHPETGKSMPVEAIAGKILSAQGELTWVVTILHDRTEAMEKARLFEQLKLAKGELETKVHLATAELAQQNELLRRQALDLEQASALKSRFLANMSHEFRTPLNAILGYTQIVLQGISGPLSAAQKRDLNRIDSNGRHLLDLINEILDITRIEAGRMPLNVVEFSLSELVAEVLAELEPIISRSRLAVAADVSSRLPQLRSDRQKVKQVLVNLLSNALKFTREGSVQVRGRYNAADRSVSVAVADTGIGIAPEDRERIFQDFGQVDSSTTRPYGGTGLGLAICRRLANMLGGKISMESRLGEGSTFTLTLPIRLRKK